MQAREFLMVIGQQAGERSRNCKYDPDTHPQMVRDLAQQGEFPEAWMAEIGVTPQTMRNWAQAHEEFREAVIQGRILLQTFWTREIAKNRNNPNAKPGLYLLIARRFKDLYAATGNVDLAEWVLRKEEAEGVPGDTPPAQMSDDAIERRLAELRARDSVNSERDEE
ncbi:hypothetical protein [Pseudogemmobacter sonorensis]|uniref:hypothetical protein n=1 Tax=Pseudogemmobacter sonorensis TaxID=2989681 RepID=UPI0036908E44